MMRERTELQRGLGVMRREYRHNGGKSERMKGGHCGTVIDDRESDGSGEKKRSEGSDVARVVYQCMRSIVNGVYDIPAFLRALVRKLVQLMQRLKMIRMVQIAEKLRTLKASDVYKVSAWGKSTKRRVEKTVHLVGVLILFRVLLTRVKITVR